MHLEGSCHCGAVRFSMEADAPVPYLRCYCSICRKTAGGGGFAINLGGRADSLAVQGEEAITVFHARIDEEQSPAERRFCSRCGTALWVWDPSWPEFVHPFASAIDCPRLGFKPSSSRRNCFSTKANRGMLNSLESWTPP